MFKKTGRTPAGNGPIGNRWTKTDARSKTNGPYAIVAGTVGTHVGLCNTPWSTPRGLRSVSVPRPPRRTRGV